MQNRRDKETCFNNQVWAKKYIVRKLCNHKMHLNYEKDKNQRWEEWTHFNSECSSLNLGDHECSCACISLARRQCYLYLHNCSETEQG